jgi:hypothetical protein
MNDDAAGRWGLPDWLSEDGYRGHAHWDMDRWRWEFTRRRPDYREEFEKYAVAADNENQASVRGINDVSPDQPDDPGFCALSPNSWKFGLGGLPNPAISEQPFYAISFSSLTFGELEPPDPQFLTITIDLARPYAVLIKEVGEAIREMQSDENGKISAPKAHPEKWLRYLRVLDGRECGASWGKLAKVAASENSDGAAITPQNAKQVHAAATAIMFKWPA